MNAQTCCTARCSPDPVQSFYIICSFSAGFSTAAPEPSRRHWCRKPDQPEPNFTSIWQRSSQLLRVFLGSIQPAGRCQPHWVLGKVYFHGPSALLNGPCEARGVERHANTGGVMGAVCTRVIPAKNICIRGAALRSISSECLHQTARCGVVRAAEAAAPDPILVFFLRSSC